MRIWLKQKGFENETFEKFDWNFNLTVSSFIKVSYNKRDLILYALSIGTKEDELKYLYELG